MKPTGCGMQPRMTMQRTLKLYRLDKKTATAGLRPMLPTDASQVRVAENSWSGLYMISSSCLNPIQAGYGRSSYCCKTGILFRALPASLKVSWTR